MNPPICLDCEFSKAIDREHAYCKKTGNMVPLTRGSCEKFRNGLRRFQIRNVALVLFPILVASIGSDIGGALDKILTTCLVIFIILILLFALWFISTVFGKGGQRG